MKLSETYTFIDFFLLLKIIFVIVSVLYFDVGNEEILQRVGPGKETFFTLIIPAKCLKFINKDNLFKVM